MLHHGQGKWYPGEQLPRWALSCFFRKDGVPVWNEPKLFAQESAPPGHKIEQAEIFVKRLIEVLGLKKHGLMPAYEDAFYYLWRERRLPANVDPLKSNLADPIERARIARVFRQDLGSIVGYCLPLAYQRGWVSGDWFLREEHLFLMPGDSAMGLRLPLDSLPWIARGDIGHGAGTRSVRRARGVAGGVSLPAVTAGRAASGAPSAAPGFPERVHDRRSAPEAVALRVRDGHHAYCAVRRAA